MSQALPYNYSSDSSTCFIYPRPYIPNGTLLTYDNCPEEYKYNTPKLVKYCCFLIIYDFTHRSNYKKVQDFLRDYSSTLLLIPAVFFNILTLCVLRGLSKSRAKTSTTNYMKFLCYLDTLTIFSKFIHETLVVRNAIRENPIAINSFMCKFISFFESTCTISSIYMLIAMSIDKLICVLKPLKVNQLLTPRNARISTTCILTVAAVFSSYELFAQHSIELKVSKQKDNFSQNVTEKEYILIGYDCDTKWPEWSKDWILVNNIIKVFVPIVILCVCNTWIVISLTKSKKKTDALFVKTETSLNKSSNLSMNHTRSKHIQLTKFNNINNGLTVPLTRNLSNSNSTRGQHRERSLVEYQTNSKNEKWLSTNQQISLMLFVVSLGFVLMNLPYAIKTLFQRQFSETNKIQAYMYHTDNLFRMNYTKTEITDSVIYEFASNFTHFLLDLNYIANFFLYFFVGERFRTQLFNMLRCQKNKAPSATQLIIESHMK